MAGASGGPCPRAKGQDFACLFKPLLESSGRGRITVIGPLDFQLAKPSLRPLYPFGVMEGEAMLEVGVGLACPVIEGLIPRRRLIKPIDAIKIVLDEGSEVSTLLGQIFYFALFQFML
jgi:hypothetical protein